MESPKTRAGTPTLGCTHYPVIIEQIRDHMPQRVKVVAQGDIVARSLADYLLRHPEIETAISRGGSLEYLTTESPLKFNSIASRFMPDEVNAHKITLP